MLKQMPEPDPTKPQVKAEDVLEQANKPGGGQSFSKKSRSRVSNALLESLQTSQGKTIATGLSTILVVALLFFLAITPAVSSITRQLEVNKRLKERNALMETKIQQLLQLAQKEEQYAEDLKKFTEIFNQELHQDDIYNEMTKTAQLTKMEFRGMTFEANTSAPNKYQEAELDEHLRFQAVKITVYGQFGNIDNFLIELEKSKRILDIQTISMSADEASEGSVILDVTANTIYWLPEE